MNTSNTYIKNLAVAILILAAIVMSACEDNATGVREASGPPQLDRVSLVTKDSTTATGQRGVQYVIWGDNLAATRSVTFSGAEANINPALATDQNIIVTVPLDAPYANASDSLVVTNPKGSASLPFNILQPPPTFNGFTPTSGPSGEVITLNGNVFINVSEVLIGNVEANIISSSQTEVQIEVPEGINYGQISVTTPGGTTASERPFGFRYKVYGDALHSLFYNGSYSGTAKTDNTENISGGTNSIKMEYTNSYGGFIAGYYGAEPIDMSQYSTLKVSIYGGENVGKVTININGDSENSVTLPVVAGEYKDFYIPLSDLGSPSTFSQVIIQNASSLFTIYIDNLGFY